MTTVLNCFDDAPQSKTGGIRGRRLPLHPLALAQRLCCPRIDGPVLAGACFRTSRGATHFVDIQFSALKGLTGIHLPSSESSSVRDPSKPSPVIHLVCPLILKFSLMIIK